MSQETKTKDKMRAARMKAEGVTRKVCTCPICNKLIGLSSYYAHVTNCKG